MDSDPQNPGGAGPEPVTPSTESVVGSRPTAKRSGSGRLLNIALGGALVLAIAGVAFAAGRVTAPAATIAGNFPNGGPNGGPNAGQLPFPSGGFPGNGGNRPGGGFIGGNGVTIEGTVEALSETTLTIRTADGRTIQVALDQDTTYHAQTDASASDVTTGGKVQVRLDLQGQGSGGTPTMAADDVTVVP